MDRTAAFDAGSTIAGYLGAGVVIVGHLLNQKGLLRSEDRRFPGMNLLGSALVMISLLYHLNPPSIVIETFWSAISVYGIQKNLRAARDVGWC